MVLTPSTMLPLGTEAAPFRLRTPSGREVCLDDFSDAKGLLVMFICNHCPYVMHVRQELARFGREYGARGLAIVAINSNDVEAYPEDGPDEMAEEIERQGYTFPYLLDADQSVAKAYHAACTPDFFLFDGRRRLAYRGQLDSSRPGNDVPVTGEDLRAAADAVLAGKPVPVEQNPSAGCNIKWKAGSAPDDHGDESVVSA